MYALRLIIIAFIANFGTYFNKVQLPYDDWQEIGLSPKRAASFAMADGTAVERKISECCIELPQGDGHTPIILGEPGDTALLGVVTLEILGLVLNPFNRTLQPMRMLLV